MYQIRIADLLPIRLVNYGVARACTVGEAAEAPEAVATRDGGGCDPRHNHGGGRASVWQNSRHGGRQLRLLSSNNVRLLGGVNCAGTDAVTAVKGTSARARTAPELGSTSSSLTR